MTRQNEVEILNNMIEAAVDADDRGDAANRNHIVSQILGDLDLPRAQIIAALKKAGLRK